MGLRAGDLKSTVYHIFEIDSFASKMGDDKNIITLSFSVTEKEPADDLVSFLEKGYSFILDADLTPGEQTDGTYKVFVEIERNKNSPEEIMELVDGLKKVTNIDRELKFRYYKDFRSHVATLENLKQFVPTDPKNYGIVATESNLNNFKNFFNRSYLESVEMLDDVLTIKKKYADPIKFKFIDIVESAAISKIIQESFDINAYPEILFLTKYIGDYNISKYGDKIVFENKDNALVLKRI